MAGVGLELRSSYQERKSFLGLFRVFGYAASLAGGPWLVTIIAVALLCIMGLKKYSWGELTVFTASAMYAFAGSILLTAPLLLPLGRFLADQSFVGRMDQRRMLLAVEAALWPAGLLLGFGGAWYFLPDTLSNPLVYRVSAALLTAALSALWPVIVYLDFRRKFAHPFYAFILGSMVALAAGYLAETYFGASGFMAGYTLGVYIIYGILLAAALERSALPARTWEQEMPYLRSSARKFAALAWTGLFYNLGIWADKFVFWYFAGAPVAPDARLRVHHTYDIATFMAYLVMIPGIAYFLLVVESSFYKEFRKYLSSVESDPYNAVEAGRKTLVGRMNRQVYYLLELQFLLTVAAAFIGPAVFRTMGLNEQGIPIYRVLIWAASLQVMLWVDVLLLFYFEFRVEAVAVALFFCISNAALSWLSLAAPGLTPGWGYLASVFFSVLLGFALLQERLKDLHRHIFHLHVVQPPPPPEAAAPRP